MAYLGIRWIAPRKPKDFDWISLLAILSVLHLQPRKSHPAFALKHHHRVRLNSIHDILPFCTHMTKLHTQTKIPSSRLPTSFVLQLLPPFSWQTYGLHVYDSASRHGSRLSFSFSFAYPYHLLSRIAFAAFGQ